MENEKLCKILTFLFIVGYILEFVSCFFFLSKSIYNNIFDLKVLKDFYISIQSYIQLFGYKIWEFQLFENFWKVNVNGVTKGCSDLIVCDVIKEI